MASKNFEETLLLKKQQVFECVGNLMSLITVSHMASCNLRNLERSFRRFCEVYFFSRSLTDFINYNKPAPSLAKFASLLLGNWMTLQPFYGNDTFARSGIILSEEHTHSIHIPFVYSLNLCF